MKFQTRLEATSARLLGTKRSRSAEESARIETRPPDCPPRAAVVAAISRSTPAMSTSSLPSTASTSIPKLPQRKTPLYLAPRRRRSVAAAPKATIHAASHRVGVCVSRVTHTARRGEKIPPMMRTVCVWALLREGAATCGWAAAGHGRKGQRHWAQREGGTLHRRSAVVGGGHAPPLTSAAATRCESSWRTVKATMASRRRAAWNMTKSTADAHDTSVCSCSLCWSVRAVERMPASGPASQCAPGSDEAATGRRARI
mmetsp:Transcript_27351/g.67488  ORF Transcript_27351/g.67488 Transcript_27351/m.67488 type:complete len:257 (-) Transcript_27351:170-940(-)